MEKNIFEKIIDREIPAEIIYEDERVISFLDIEPIEPGHLLVVPKKRYKYVWEMPEEDFLYLQKIILLISKKIEKELSCGLNIIQNNKKVAGQEIFHVHFHLIPRKIEKKYYIKADGYKNEEEKREFVEKMRFNN